MLRNINILVLLIGLLFCVDSIAQKPRGDWSLGITGSVEAFLRTLTDAERFDIDTNLNLGISDADYLAEREKMDKLHVPGMTAGIHVGYKVSPRIQLETGVRFVNGGIKADLSQSSHPAIVNIFGSENYGETVINPYRIIEMPIILKHRLGTPNKHDLAGRKKGTPLTNMYRYFFFSYGVGIGFPVNGNEFYNGIEHSGIQGNAGLAALASVGYHVDTRSPFYFNLRAHARATFLSYYEYAPIKSYYHAIGGEIKLGYRFAYKSKGNKNTKATDCSSFTDGPNSKSRAKFMFGLRYGAQINFLMGSSASNPLLGFQQTAPGDIEDIETASGGPRSSLTPHLGFHAEYLFHPLISIGVSPTYAQRGFISQHTYFMDDGKTIKTRQRAYINYADVPIKVTYYPTQRFWAHLGGIVSIYTDDRLYDYYQVYNGLNNFPNENVNYRKEIGTKAYFGDPVDPFILGWEIGGGAHLDDNVAVSVQMQFFEQVFQEGNGREDFWNTSLQVSMYYYLYKK